MENEIQNSLENFSAIKKEKAMLKEGLEQEAYELGEKVKEELNKGQDYVKDSLHSLEEKTKSHPLMAVGISFLLGMVASRILGGK